MHKRGQAERLRDFIQRVHPAVHLGFSDSPDPARVQVEDEELGAHRIILAARSPVFAALLHSGMREAGEGVVTVEDCRAPVFRALLHFVYTDALPEVC